MQPSYDDFDGALLRRIREALDVTRAELGLQAGVPAKRIAGFEAGRERPTPEVIRELAAYLRVSTYCFYDPDVIVTPDEIEVRWRPGETEEEWSARFQAAAPPLSDDAKAAIRQVSDEYWMAERSRKRKGRHG